MRDFWRRHRAVRILSYVGLALVFLLCAVPYLIPLGQPQAQISPDGLVGEHGQFLDIDGAAIYVEEQNPDLFNSVVLTFLRSHGDQHSRDIMYDLW